MINFSCRHCGKSFSVGAEFAGRVGKCKACGQEMVVPKPSPTNPNKIVISFEKPAATNPVSAAATKSLSPRLRRLAAEAEQVRSAFQAFAPIRIVSTTGNPPETYVIEFRVNGLVRGPNGVPTLKETHTAEIYLPKEYPRQGPHCRMLSPIFHPNIEPATICIGDHWTAGERLVDLICRIAELIAFQAHNIKSPLDGEAAMWADQNQGRLPIDRRDLRPPSMD